jgi:hypothetical protein
MTSRPSTAAPILAALAILLLPLAAYLGGYFWLGTRADRFHVLTSELARIDRTYPQRWLAIIYQPAARAEETVRDVEVEIRLAGWGRIR